MMLRSWVIVGLVSICTAVAPYRNDPVLRKNPSEHPIITTESTEYPIHRFKADGYRLPTNILPVSYKVQLLPFVEEGNFTTDGYVEMTVECIEPTFNIVFHSAEITIDISSVSVYK